MDVNHKFLTDMKTYILLVAVLLARQIIRMGIDAEPFIDNWYSVGVTSGSNLLFVESIGCITETEDDQEPGSRLFKDERNIF